VKIESCFGTSEESTVFEVYKSVLEQFAGMGPWGPPGFVALYILGCLLLCPGFPLTCGAGMIFGFPLGALYVACGVNFGAALAFGIARHFSGIVPEGLRNSGSAAWSGRVLASTGWRAVALVRLCPIFPFRICNYLFGFSRVSFSQYTFGTALGTLPSVLTYTALGSTLGSFAELYAAGEASMTTSSAKVLTGTSVLLLIVMALAGRRAARILERSGRV
jgi:uncharacterized membrane protein YdjX (TVP38/TMEM64 family)